ncbi:MAG: UDP-N-acetylmuramate dehydrogenase [Chitinophagaceae bacterium]
MELIIQENISLKPFHSFAMEVNARYFTRLSSMDQLPQIFGWKKSSSMVLGGGSNLLFTKNYDGLIIKNEMKGIHLIREDDHHVYVRAGAGEGWHSLVLHCINNGWAGMENLSLIPGTVGAAPIQNIGAYGVELKDIFFGLEAYHIKEEKLHQFSLNDCAFGYRDSIFKRSLKGELVITQVIFRLNKIPEYKITYGAIEQELEKMNIKELSIQAISQAVCRIRSSKLPDPAVMGNAGSFFKNPAVPENKYSELKEKFPGLVGYHQMDGSYKLAAGWLIEYCGWKGYRRDDAGCHALQSLVLVNYGHATGAEIFKLSEDIQRSVFEKFEVRLETEVNII